MKHEKCEGKECCHDGKRRPSGLFVPSGVLLGIGFGFLFNELLAGLFIGLGLGFLAFALSMIMTRSRVCVRPKCTASHGISKVKKLKG
ncbi:MAG: hypothetical protein NUV53_02630 [Patescibacteria group bacterium]|nr:hypothetical protein [Patescibacteria group bacterium]